MLLPEWLRVLVAVLAVYRLAQLVTIDHGPGGIFQALRDRGGAYDRGPDGQAKTDLGKFLSCPHCCGVWFAGALTVLVLFPTWPGDAVLLVLGLAGAQSYLQGKRNPR